MTLTLCDRFYIKARRTTAPANPMEQLPQVIAQRRTSDGKGTPRNPPPPKTKDFAVISAVTSIVAATEKDPLKILIVEDNLVNQRVLQKQLKNMGCITYVANHGGEALEHLRNSWFWSGRHDEPGVAHINVVLMDQVSGVMAWQEINKTNTLLKEMPVMVSLLVVLHRITLLTIIGWFDMYETHSRAGSGRLYPCTCADHCRHSQREFRIQTILKAHRY